MEFSRIQKLMLLNAQPAKFWLNLVGGTIALYFLWHHQLTYALVLGGLIILSGTIIASFSTKNAEHVLAQTQVGKLFLRYSSPFGLICYCISHILVPVSVWSHQVMPGMIGLILLVVGAARIPAGTQAK